MWRNLCTSLLYFVVRVRYRRKESSRSLSRLLMSFLSTSSQPDKYLCVCVCVNFGEEQQNQLHQLTQKHE